MYTSLFVETMTRFLVWIRGLHRRKLHDVELQVLALVLLAAVAHAAWNGWALPGEKITGPRWVGVVLTVSGLVLARL